MYSPGEVLGIFGIIAFVGVFMFGAIGALVRQSWLYYVASILGIAGTLLFIFGAAASVPSCTAPVGSKIQWRKDSSVVNVDGGGTYRFYYSYLEMDDGTYCSVEDRALYDMGIGYRTTKEYTGKTIVQL